jgi:hypothetical protein
VIDFMTFIPSCVGFDPIVPAQRPVTTGGRLVPMTAMRW